MVTLALHRARALFFHAEKKQSFELNHACTLYIMCFVSEPLVSRNALLCSGNKQLLCYNTARHPLSLPLPSLSAGPALREESQKKTAEKKKRPAALKRQREKKTTTHYSRVPGSRHENGKS